MTRKTRLFVLMGEGKNLLEDFGTGDFSRKILRDQVPRQPPH